MPFSIDSLLARLLRERGNILARLASTAANEPLPPPLLATLAVLEAGVVAARDEIRRRGPAVGR